VTYALLIAYCVTVWNVTAAQARRRIAAEATAAAVARVEATQKALLAAVAELQADVRPIANRK
jgi:hypothetical protein